MFKLVLTSQSGNVCGGYSVFIYMELFTRTSRELSAENSVFIYEAIYVVNTSLPAATRSPVRNRMIIR